MAELTTAYIGLGSNLGDRGGTISVALKMLAEAEELEVTRISDLIETIPLGGTNQLKYLNAVAEIKTALSVEDLHKKVVDIEAALGRVRRIKWSPRTIDLDLLLFGGEVINRPNLIVPHYQMHLRSFVLEGLSQLNAELQHPVMKESVSELASRLNGSNFVPNPDLPQLISIAGVIGVGKTTLAQKLSQALRCQLLLEPYDENPFMPDVYAGKKELALDSQLYFLTHRAGQLNRNILEPGRITISDYIFDKELIYARQTLNTQQLALYEKIYQPFAAEVASPVLVVYLTDSVQECLERIHKRNRPYEQAIKKRFLESLRSGYEQLFVDWKACPVIRKQMSNLDCMKDADIELLANQIRSYAAVK